MDIFLIVTGAILILLGLVGCIIPFVPGPPLVYAGLLLQVFRQLPPFSTRFLVIWGIVTAVVTLLDYLIPVCGVKRFGGSRSGMWGSAVGMVVGLWFGPVGLIVGPVLGAWVGELLARRDAESAMRAAMGSLVGFLLGTGLKLIISLLMAYHFVRVLLT